MEVVKIEDKELQVKEWNGKRVVTFKEIDLLHGRTDGTARRNFNQNKSKFIENEDYFTLDSVSVNEIRSYDSSSFGNAAKHGIVLTESGYLMLVKSFTDDLSWKVQRQLVNSYFKTKEKTDLSLDDEFLRVKLYENKYLCDEIDLKKFSELRKSVAMCIKAKKDLMILEKTKSSPKQVEGEGTSSTSTSSSQKLPAPSCIDNPKFLETLMFLAETEERFSPSRCYELFCNKVPGLKKEFGTSNVMSQKLKAGLVDKFGVVFSSERRSLGRLWSFRKIGVDADEV